MSKDKISDYSSTANSNTDIAGINIDEGCAPSGINDAIRTLMAQLKNFQQGTGGDSFNGPFAGTTIAATDTTDASSTTAAAMKTAGGLAVAKKAYVGLDANIYGLTVGRGAGSVSTNTAVGASALAANTSGSGNTAIGANSLDANTSGIQNIGIGVDALGANTTANSNTAVGWSAMRVNTTGANNASFGTYSMYDNTTGSSNTAIGVSALENNTTASYNTAVGYQAGYSATTLGFSTLLGGRAGYSTTGNANTFIGDASGYYVTSGTANTILGRYNGNQGGLDIRTASNYIVLSDGDGNPRLYYSTAGGTWVSAEIYASTTASAANLQIAASGTINRSTSALKYKQDIRDVEDFDISALRPVRYKSKCEGDDQTKDHLGLIADEAAEAGFDELVTRNEAGEIEGFQYERLTVVLLKELQTLKAKVAALENQ